MTYRVVPRALRLLWRYWYCLLMVSRSGRYSGVPFQGQCGVTQGGPLSPMIFNVVMDASLHHWVSVVEEAEGESGPEVFDRDVHRMA